MSDNITYEDVEKEKECPECGVKAPKRQIDNMGICERCKLDGKTVKQGQVFNPENNILDKWRLKSNTDNSKAILP